MRRVRFLRVLVLVLLLPFLVVLAVTLQPKVSPHRESTSNTPTGPRANKLVWSDFAGSRRVYEAVVGLIRQLDQNVYELEGIERLKVERRDKPPLIISAQSAGVDGDPGQRLISLEGGVEVEEEGEGLRISLPKLEVDQAAGEARSIGAVSLETPSYRGEAQSVVYGLEGEPTRIFGLDLQSEDGGTLSALRARLDDGTRDFELLGGVRATRGREFFVSDDMRIWRRPDGPLRRIVARREVSGAAEGPSALVRFRADRLETEWDEHGQERLLLLVGDALLVQEGQSVAASRIEARRQPEQGDGWQVHASGSVYAKSSLREEQAVLRARDLRATLGPEGGVILGQVSGNVSFSGPDFFAEAEEAVFDPDAREAEIVLAAGPRRRARLARGATRVAANRIATDREGVRVAAEGKVEATLLPAKESQPVPVTAGLFRTNQAVHFVASRLVSEQSGSRLTFSGAVRGWQGDRTLSANEVLVDQTNRDLQATGQVSTRTPREESVSAVSQADYLQISADRLDYSERAALAIYTGKSRIRLAEGWMEAHRVEVELSEQESGIKELRAFGDIRFEFRTQGDEGLPRPVTGEGDRVVYTPADHSVLLYGDEDPASVRRGAEGGGTTTGRVLRYRLDVGTLKVESGDQDRVTIRTPSDS